MLQVIQGELVGTRAARFLEYAAAVGEGEIVSRRQMAERMGASYGAALYNLERAVSEGALNKQYGFASSQQPGWLYALPGTFQTLPGF